MKIMEYRFISEIRPVKVFGVVVVDVLEFEMERVLRHLFFLMQGKLQARYDYHYDEN
jgi:hypothetical protein